MWLVVLTALFVGVVAGVQGTAHAGDEDRAGVALFDPATGAWHLRYPDGSEHHFLYGNPGDVPLMGDWNCDGFDTVGMYRPSNGFVYIRNANGFGVADEDFFYGLAGDVALVGDWNNDGCDTLAIYRRGTVYVRNSLGTGAADYSYFFGDTGDRPFSGDFDADGTSSVGLYRESTGFAYLRNTNSSGFADLEFFYGEPSDRIFIGDWDGSGSETVGIFRPTEAAYYLSNNNWTGVADIVDYFGFAGFVPVGGRFGPPDLSNPSPTTTTTTPTSTTSTTTTSTTTTSSTTTTTTQPPAGPLRIMPIGDSITEGNPVANTYRFYLSNAYGTSVDLVGSKSGAFGGSPPDGGFDQDHQAYWGWRADEVAPQVDWAADVYVPDVGLIHLGTNDLLQQQDVASTIADIRSTINHLRDANPNVDVFVAQILKCSCYGLRDHLNDAIFGLASEMNTSQSRVVSVWMDNIEYGDLHDGIHPSNTGSEKMFWNWESAMQAAGLL